MYFNNTAKSAATPQPILKTSSAAAQAVTAEIMSANPLDPQTYNPSHYLVTAGATFGATISGVGVKQINGVESVDHNKIIRDAEIYMAQGARSLSAEQKTVVQKWIAEARVGLRNVLQTQSSERFVGKSADSAAQPPLLAKLPTGASATFGRLLDDAAKVFESVNPDRNSILARQPELVHTLQTLKNFHHAGNYLQDDAVRNSGAV